jgi:ribose transport system permease protein
MFNILRRGGLLIALIIVFLLFYILVPQFRSFTNLMNIIRSATVVGLFAIGLTVIVNAGEFDLSFPAVATVVAAISGVLLLSNGVSMTITIIISLLVGLIVGAINGGLIAYLGVPAFIQTLGMWGLLTGISGYLTKGADYYDPNWPVSLSFFGRGFILNIIPVPVIFFIIISIFISIYIEFSVSGRKLIAVGFNDVASRYLGINTKKVKFTAYLISSLISTIAGIIALSLLGQVSHLMVNGYQLTAISAVFLGAIFLRDGIPNVFGTIIASLLLSVISNGIIMIGAKWYASNILEGVVLIIAVGILALLKKGSLKSVSI